MKFVVDHITGLLTETCVLSVVALGIASFRVIYKPYYERQIAQW